MKYTIGDVIKPLSNDPAYNFTYTIIQVHADHYEVAHGMGLSRSLAENWYRKLTPLELVLL